MTKFTRSRWLLPALACVALLGGAGCEKQSSIAAPEPHTLTSDASGYYCLMTVVYHDGPKGQIILSDGKVNWFTSYAIPSPLPCCRKNLKTSRRFM